MRHRQRSHVGAAGDVLRGGTAGEPALPLPRVRAELRPRTRRWRARSSSPARCSSRRSAMRAACWAGSNVSRWPALLAGPIACGWMFRWGLVPNLLGFTLFVALASAPRAPGQASLTTPRRGVGGRGGPHLLRTSPRRSSSRWWPATSRSFAAVGCGRPCGADPARPRDAAARAAPAARRPRAHRHEHGSRSGTTTGSIRSSDSPILPGVSSAASTRTRLAVIGGVWLVALVAGAVSRATRAPRTSRSASRCGDIAIPVLAAVFFFMFLGFPMSLAGTTLLAHRFLPAACVFLIAACAPRSGSTGARAARDGRPDRDARHRDEELPRGRSALSRSRRGAAPPPEQRGGRAARSDAHAGERRRAHAGAASRALSEHGGRMLFAFTDMPPNPVYVRPETAVERADAAHGPHPVCVHADPRRAALLVPARPRHAASTGRSPPPRSHRKRSSSRRRGSGICFAPRCRSIPSTRRTVRCRLHLLRR